MKSEKYILILGIILVAGLTIKSLKQFVYLSFTLLSLKIVWVGIIFISILMFLKRSHRATKDK